MDHTAKASPWCDSGHDPWRYLSQSWQIDNETADRGQIPKLADVLPWIQREASLSSSTYKIAKTDIIGPESFSCGAVSEVGRRTRRRSMKADKRMLSCEREGAKI